MNAYLITAITPSGYAASDPWSPSLDGIAAYRLMQNRLGPEFAFSQGVPGKLVTVDDLPIEKTEYGDLWWYQVSAPIPAQKGKKVFYTHRRFDALHAEKNMAGGGKIMTAAGPFKNARTAIETVLTPSVSWHVITDDVGALLELLSPVTHIGRLANAGYGRVTEWLIKHGGNPDLARYHRPVPVAYADKKNIAGLKMTWGLVPPGRINRVDCVCPM
jgi:CRISPR type IV-associated protein Csf3